MTGRYQLGKPTRCGDGFSQEVVGGRPAPGGGATYFISRRSVKARVPHFSVHYCDGALDLAQLGLGSATRNNRWTVLGEDMPLTKARRLLRQHFDATFGLANRALSEIEVRTAAAGAGCWDLVINGEMAVAGESFAVVDQVAAELRCPRWGSSEVAEAARSIERAAVAREARRVPAG